MKNSSKKNASAPLKVRTQNSPNQRVVQLEQAVLNLKKTVSLQSVQIDQLSQRSRTNRKNDKDALMSVLALIAELQRQNSLTLPVITEMASALYTLVNNLVANDDLGTPMSSDYVGLNSVLGGSTVNRTLLYTWATTQASVAPPLDTLMKSVVALQGPITASLEPGKSWISKSLPTPPKAPAVSQTVTPVAKSNQTKESASAEAPGVPA